MAAYDKELNTAEIAYAAIDEVIFSPYFSNIRHYQTVLKHPPELLRDIPYKHIDISRTYD